jgi:acyl-coenzyme A thioesterase PaaI-like protein
MCPYSRSTRRTKPAKTTREQDCRAEQEQNDPAARQAAAPAAAARFRGREADARPATTVGKPDEFRLLTPLHASPLACRLRGRCNQHNPIPQRVAGVSLDPSGQGVRRMLEGAGAGEERGAMDDVEPQVETVGARLKVRDDHYCFGCGRLNPWGLKLSFYESADGSGLWAQWTPVRQHEGYDGIAHGGIVTTVLDEVMAWTAYRQRIWAVTGRIAVRFRRPVEIGVATRASGRIVADRGRLLELAGELRRESDGVVLAEATGTFVRVAEEQAGEWRRRYLGDISQEGKIAVVDANG